MKILLLNPPFLPRFSREQRSPAVTKSGTIYYPMWLAYATGVLIKNGYDAVLIDGVTRNWTKKDVYNWVKENKPKLAVLGTSTPSIYNDIEIGELIKEAYPESFIVLVGTHVSALPKETLQLSPKIDAIAVREYDYTILEVAQALEGNTGFENIRGLVYRKDGIIHSNPLREYITNLDDLPMVSTIYKKFLNYKDYFYSIALWPEVTIITGRGCPYQCKYCVYPQVQTGHKLRYRSIEAVIEEFKYIVDNFPDVKEIFIEDDTLTVNRERVIEFSEKLISSGIKVSWTANSRADLDYFTLKLMKRAGCRLLCVGFESGVQDILNSMSKRNTIERAKRFVKDAKRAGVMIHGCFMVGNIGETKQTMRKTLEFAKKLNTDTAQFFPIMVYPGTAMYDWVKSKGYLRTEEFDKWITPDGMHNCVVDLPGLKAEEMVKFCDQARREYYLRLKYILFKLKQIILHPKEAQRTLKSFKIFYKYLFRGTYK